MLCCTFLSVAVFVVLRHCFILLLYFFPPHQCTVTRPRLREKLDRPRPFTPCLVRRIGLKSPLHRVEMERRDKSTVVKKNWMHKPKKKKRLGIRMTMSIPGDISTGETLRLVYESDEKEKINSIKGGTSRFVSDLSESHTYEGTVRSKEKD